jgi:hypothetical protein
MIVKKMWEFFLGIFLDFFMQTRSVEEQPTSNLNKKLLKKL